MSCSSKPLAISFCSFFCVYLTSPGPQQDHNRTTTAPLPRYHYSSTTTGGRFGRRAPSQGSHMNEKPFQCLVWWKAVFAQLLARIGPWYRTDFPRHPSVQAALPVDGIIFRVLWGPHPWTRASGSIGAARPRPVGRKWAFSILPRWLDGSAFVPQGRISLSCAERVNS